MFKFESESVIAGLTRNPKIFVNKILTIGSRLRVKPAMTGLLFLLIAQVSFAQEIASPLDIPLLLSGNCGELRTNHFHSGIDLKTQSKTGFPVYAAANGYIARIFVSPFGYGNALYINHPDGKTSVYGHLLRFTPAIEALVRDTQYQKETFATDIYLTLEQFPVRRGEQIARSGNSGSSGGPHVHFELRDTKSGDILDPLPYFQGRMKDTHAPEIRALMIYPQFNRGIANGSARNQAFNLATSKSGQKSLAKEITAWGQIGIGIKAYDRMNETPNSYGVKEIILKVDGEEVFHSLLDRFSLNDTRYINSFMDFTEWTENKSFYMKSFIEPGNQLNVYHAPGNGIISIDREKTYRLEYILKDAYGNTGTFKFDITGRKMPVPHTKPTDTYFPFNQDNTYTEKGIELKIPKGNLYTDMYLKTRIVPGGSDFSPRYIVGDRIPLHSYCPLTLDITNDDYPDKSKYGVVSEWNGKKTWLGGKYNNGKMVVQIRELGSFSVGIDTVPPVVTPVNQANWTANKRIAFKISDNLSGILSYRGTLNGKFVLFEYDPKINSLYYVYDAKRMGTGEQALELIVTDAAGNETLFYIPRL